MNKELNCIRVFGTKMTLFASAILLFLPPFPSSSSSSSHRVRRRSSSMATQSSPLLKALLTGPPISTFVGGLWEDYSKMSPSEFVNRRPLADWEVLCCPYTCMMNTPTHSTQRAYSLMGFGFHWCFHGHWPPIVFHSCRWIKSSTQHVDLFA